MCDTRTGASNVRGGGPYFFLTQEAAGERCIARDSGRLLDAADAAYHLHEHRHRGEMSIFTMVFSVLYLSLQEIMSTLGDTQHADRESIAHAHSLLRIIGEDVKRTLEECNRAQKEKFALIVSRSVSPFCVKFQASSRCASFFRIVVFDPSSLFD